jgi:hypothetical protein
MSEHLPECTMADPQPAFRYACICERLRAAEQRGYGNAMDDGWGEPEHIKAAVDRAKREWVMDLFESNDYRDGKRAGVKAARDAVDEFFRKMDEVQPLERDHRVALEWSLAAIDALTGHEESPPPTR